MAKAIIYKGYLSDTEAEHFERLNPGWTVKNCDVLCFTDDRGTSTEYVIFTGPWTKTEMCRDCGECYVIASLSQYFRVNKGNLQVTITGRDE